MDALCITMNDQRQYNEEDVLARMLSECLKRSLFTGADVRALGVAGRFTATQFWTKLYSGLGHYGSVCIARLVGSALIDHGDC